MKRILLCFLLLTGICLSGCTGQINQPDTPPSTSEESGVLPGSESGGSTEMTLKESTIPSEASKQVLTLTIDGIAVDLITAGFAPGPGFGASLKYARKLHLSGVNKGRAKKAAISFLKRKRGLPPCVNG